MADHPYRFRMKAKDYYTHLSKCREGVLEKARELSQISIPTLMPPQNWKAGDRLPAPNQSVNSRCFNVLASKLMLVAFPPGRPNLKFEVLEHKLESDIAEDPALYAEITAGLALREQAHRKRFEQTALRAIYTTAMLQALGAGNWLWQHDELDNPVAHKMDTYVVKRNKKGVQRDVILLEPTYFVDLSDEDKQTVRLVQVRDGIMRSNEEEEDETVDIYTCLRWDNGQWRYWQEYEGQLLKGTEADFPEDEPPMLASWLVPNPGQNWGISYAELFQGDMYIVENSQGALNDGAEISALNWLFVRPGAATSKRTLERAENRKIMTGEASDVTGFRYEKNGDFAVVDTNLDKAIQRLSAAFLLMSSIQRDAERVTAEEWRRLASELDSAMGGLYSQLAQSFQRYVLTNAIRLHEEEDDDLVPLPKDITSVGVVTGVDMLGRTADVEALTEATAISQQALGPQVVAQEMVAGNFLTRIFSAFGINTKGLFKSDEQKKTEVDEAKQDVQNQTVLDKATGPVAKAGADSVAAMVMSQLQNQNPGAQ